MAGSSVLFQFLLPRIGKIYEEIPESGPMSGSVGVTRSLLQGIRAGGYSVAATSTHVSLIRKGKKNTTAGKHTFAVCVCGRKKQLQFVTGMK